MIAADAGEHALLRERIIRRLHDEVGLMALDTATRVADAIVSDPLLAVAISIEIS